MNPARFLLPMVLSTPLPAEGIRGIGPHKLTHCWLPLFSNPTNKDGERKL